MHKLYSIPNGTLLLVSTKGYPVKTPKYNDAQMHTVRLSCSKCCM